MKQEYQKIAATIQNYSGEKQIETVKLYPGISITFLSLTGGEPLAFSHEPLAHVLEINYCLSGRIGWHMDSGNQIYLGPGDFSLHTMDVCAQSSIAMPGGAYQGILICVDLEILSKHPPEALLGSNVTGEFLYEKFCKGNSCTALAGSESVQQIFSALYQAPEGIRLAYQRVKILELLLILSTIEVSREKHLTQYRSEQVALIRKIHDQLTQDLSKRSSIEYLAKQYLINPTTLKNMFKSIYGTSIAAHIREHRMEAAAKQLISTDLSIAEVASKVGYDSQSRFSAAFKNYFHVLPKEYRRQHMEL